MIQIYAFVALLCAYGLFGSPTPDAPNWQELLIALALIIAIGTAGIAYAFGSLNGTSRHVSPTKLSSPMRLLLYYGLSAPLIIAAFKGADAVLIMRDIIGFLFLLLPLFLLPLMHSKQSFKGLTIEKLCLYGAVFIGVFFALRVLFPQIAGGTELLYLANSPLVVFTAIYCMGQAFYSLKLSLKAIIKLAGYTLITGLVVMAMLQDVQRAPMAALILSLVFIIIDQFIKAPRKAVMSILVLGVGLTAIWPLLNDVLQALAYKTSVVGLNMRSQELAAAWQVLSQTPQSFLFGIGWGGQFESPAVGNLNVTFTHSLLSYMALKTGFIGLILTLIYIGVIVHHGAIVFFKDRVVGIALLWAFIIPIFLYASYKSLDFGLLLTLILALSLCKEQPNNQRVTK